MDTILISNLVAPVKIGVSAEERSVAQRIQIDVSLGTDFTEVIRTIDLKDGVNYACIRKLIFAVAEKRDFILLEELGHVLIQKIFEGAERVSEITITAAKLDIPGWRKTIPRIVMTRKRGE